MEDTVSGWIKGTGYWDYVMWPPDIGTVSRHMCHCIQLNLFKKMFLKLLWNTSVLYSQEHKATVAQTIEAEDSL